MTPISFTRYPPPVELDESDPYVAYLLRQAPQDIRDVAFRYALSVLCDGKAGLIVTFNALDMLLCAYEAVGETSFSTKEIALLAPGVSRGRISNYLRELAARRVIQITGRKEGKQLQRKYKDEHQDLRAGTYYIDREYLHRLAAKMYAELMRQLSLPLPRPQPRPAPGQQALHLDADSALDERGTLRSLDDSHNGLGAQQSSRDDCFGRSGERLTPLDVSQGEHHAPSAAILTPMDVSQREHHAPGAAILTPLDVSQGEHHAPGAAILTPLDVSQREHHAPGAAILTPLDVSQGGHHAPGAAILTPLEVSGRERTAKVSSPDVDSDIEGGRLLSSIGAMIDHMIDHGSDRESVEGSRALRGHTHIHVTLRDIVRQELQTALGGITQASLNASPQPAEYPEKVPAPPDGESEVGAGPLQTWAEATGSYPAPGVALQLRELECQFNKKAGGYGAYWLVRVIRSASLSIREPSEMKPPYLLPIFRRLEAGNFDSSVLIDRSEPRQKPQEPEPEQRTAPDRRTGDPGSDLASELRAVPAVATWLEEAPRGAAPLTTQQAEYIRDVVRDGALWRSVLQGWKVGKRNVAASYGNVSGQVDRYQQESRALQAHQGERRHAPQSELVEAHKGADQVKQQAVMRRAKEIAAKQYPHSSDAERRRVTAWLIDKLLLDRPEAEILAELQQRFPQPGAVQESVV